MNGTNSLLADYVKSGSESAFRDLVASYLNLVYSTAARLVGGDTHLAEDVSQTVFADLARKAHTLPHDVMLGGWLHRHTCFVAATLRRGERRRQNRERQAAQMNATQDHSAATLAAVAPILDEAIDQLNTEDRTAILQRFFEQKDFRAVGAVLGSNEDAARMRVTRALDKLQVLLKERGVALSAAALGTALAGEAVSAAPSGMAATIAAGALGTAAATGAASTVLKLAALTKLKAGIIGALAVAAVATPLVIQHQSETRLRDENQALRQQTEQLAQVVSENERLSNLVAQAATAPPASPSQLSELLKLRGEVTMLRQQGGELLKLREENQRLRGRPAVVQSPPAVSPAGQRTPAEQGITEQNGCINNLRQIDAAIQQCALERRLTTNDSVTIDDLLPYLIHNEMPKCPSGGVYTFGRVDQAPTCSVPAHSLLP